MSAISPSCLENAPAFREAGRPSGCQPVLQSVQARGTAHGLLLEVSIEQAYVNPGSVNIEAVYSFPLPPGAVLLGLEFELGGRRLQGRVAERPDAEARYEAALEAGDTAVLLERAADGLYTVNVGNLLARETAVVRLRYALLLSLRQGQVRITLPSVVAPRFGDPAAARLRLHQVPLQDVRASYAFGLSLRLHGPLARGEVSSPSHALAARHADGHFDISLAQGHAAVLDRDFVLLVDGLADSAVATLGRDGDGYVALASFCPAPRSASKELPLRLKILVDCSGSMNGDGIRGARQALHEILARLGPDDRFSYSRFGSRVAHHSHTLLPATARTVREASDWIAGTCADMGNTELREALLSTIALGQPVEADILLVTDASVWDTDPLVASATRSGHRIFAVGVGAAPAASLLQRLARDTGGACELVGANEETQAAVLRMFQRMRQAPARAVSVAWDGPGAWQTAAGSVVFSGETVHALAGFAEAPPASALLAWTDGEGRACEQALVFDGAAVDGDTLARVAAAQRLETLPAPERHALAMRHGLVGDTTSYFLVQERAGDQRPATMPMLRAVPQMLAAGSSGMGSVARAAVPRQPAVWRRESTAEQVQAMLRTGVEDYERPAFLRRGSEGDPFLYRGQLRVFLATHAAALRGGAGPATFAEVEDALPASVLAQLRALAELGIPVRELLLCFIAALHACFHRDSLALRLLKRIGGIGARRRQPGELERRVAAIAKGAFEARHGGIAAYDLPAFLRKQAD
ncbi:VIT and VWA domain-containing protein [Massilia oculi]|uniref:VIT and VWA domain-containing protein n=1 Tax=Massilia hydrophila TaxID=3044279 RepID=A0ABS7YFD0_9BURK|nr:VIT domain-containing protein [Massilia oculi]MCA1856944.1 VIT and VWA domain-containing protein [Massilia oculi]